MKDLTIKLQDFKVLLNLNQVNLSKNTFSLLFLFVMLSFVLHVEVSIAQNKQLNVQTSIVVSSFNDMPAKALTETLELNGNINDKNSLFTIGKSLSVSDTGLIELAKNNNITIRCIEVPEFKKTDKIVLGTTILRCELADIKNFHLIYSAEGYLIAVFPVVTDSTMRTGNSKFMRYFDFSSYYIPMLRKQAISTPEWKAFAKQIEGYQKQITAYKNYKRNNQIKKHETADSPKKPFVIATIDAAKSSIKLIQFAPYDFDSPKECEKLEAVLAKTPQSLQILFPVFPTVYSPAVDDKIEDDQRFSTHIHNYVKRLTLSKGDKLLDVGTGTGYLAWVAWATAKLSGTNVSLYSLDINPIAVTNAKTIAKIAGFSLESKPYDNVISKENRLAFDDTKFRFVIWNMPSVPLTGELPVSSDQKKSYIDYWDSGSNGTDALKRFAPAVGKLLDPKLRKAKKKGLQTKSAAVIWNTLPLDGIDVVGNTFKKEGLQANLLDKYFAKDYNITCLVYELQLP